MWESQQDYYIFIYIYIIDILYILFYILCTESHHSGAGEGDAEDGDAQDGRDDELQGGGEGFQNGVEFLEKQTGDDTEDRVVEDQNDDQRVDDGGERWRRECTY